MVKVLILGLLNKTPMHGYRIKEELKDGKYEIWANININSIYNAIRTLEKKKFISMKEVITKGHQTKSIYCITGKGKSEYKSMLFNCISSSKTIFPGDLYIGLSFITDIPEKEGLDAINKRIKSLENQISHWINGQNKKCKNDNNDFLTKLFENGIQHLNSDYRYLIFIRDNFEEFTKSITKLEKDFLRKDNDKN